ncbi:MAG: insulinase family protein [Clostridia bacterium]|nr:insulinase family protein [Clostridia bacterium]
MTEKIIKKDGALRFHVINTDKFKMSRLSFNFILPADKERSPLTRIMLAVMMRGCEKYPSIVSINKRLDELYGATVSWRAVSVGERHIFRISCEILSNKYRLPEDKTDILCEVAKVILEILFNPRLDKNKLLSRPNFESEKKLAIDAIKAKINDQKAYSAERCRRIMLEGSPAGISAEGSVEQIEGFTLEQVSENIEYFLNNSALECYYIGSDDADGVISLVSDAFSKLKRGEKEFVGGEKPLIRGEDEPLRSVTERMNVSQGRLNIGYTCGVIMSDADYPAMSLFNEIFGGSSVAKLFINVREKQSLCYYCYSSYHSATGTVMIGCGIKPENREKAFAEIEKQLLAMQSGEITDEEIKTAKRTVISGARQIYDSPSALEAFGFRRILAGLSETSEELMEKIQKVSKEEIVRVAQRVRLDTVYFLYGDGEEEFDDE